MKELFTDDDGVERYKHDNMRVARDRLGNIVEIGDDIYYFFNDVPRIGKITDMNGFADELWIDDQRFYLIPGEVVRIVPMNEVSSS